jgi:hypothetical protein
VTKPARSLAIDWDIGADQSTTFSKFRAAAALTTFIPQEREFERSR